MRTAAAIAGLSLVAAMTPMAAQAESAGALQPYQMVRSLQLVQDRVAVGDHAALPIQRKLLEMIDARLKKATAAELMQPANLRSMMIYAMSGGNPDTLRTLTRRMHVEESNGRIIAGILSYLNGATRTAALTLKDVEPMNEPIETGAFLALIKGSVIALEDPISALKLLDQSRLLAPGTLVEEAALRRSVALTVTVHDAARFIRTSDQYVRAYLRSPYASQFADAFVSGVIALRDALDLAKVDAVVAMMNPEQRKVIYLRIARRAAIDGLVSLSNYASQRADAVGGQVEAEKDPRVLLYTSLTNITTDPVEDISDRISRIDRTRLSASDRKLLDAVLAVNTAITRDPVEEAAPPVVEAPPLAPGKAVDDAVVQSGPGPDAGAHDAIPEQNSLMPEVAPEADLVPAQPAQADMAGHPAPAEPQGAPPKAAAAPTDDPSEKMLARGRKTLAEIDELLAGAAK